MRLRVIEGCGGMYMFKIEWREGVEKEGKHWVKGGWRRSKGNALELREEVVCLKGNKDT